jgi:hypothetical protein
VKEHDLSPGWLLQHGFERDPVLGYKRKLSSRGPGEMNLTLIVGNFPFNKVFISLLVDGYVITSNAGTQKDILRLIDLFDDVVLSHPYEA